MYQQIRNIIFLVIARDHPHPFQKSSRVKSPSSSRYEAEPLHLQKGRSWSFFDLIPIRLTWTALALEAARTVLLRSLVPVSIFGSYRGVMSHSVLPKGPLMILLILTEFKYRCLCVCVCARKAPRESSLSHS